MKNENECNECLRDDLWIWGQNAGCYHAPRYSYWKVPGSNKMGPVEGAAYLNIPNCCRVVFDSKPAPPFDSESEKLSSFRQVVWSALGDASSERFDGGKDDLDEVIRQAEKFPNITGGILDDLFMGGNVRNARITPERMKEMADRLHHAVRPLSLWVVYYATFITEDIDFSAWLDLADVVTFWSWTSRELANAEQNLHCFIEKTPGKRHYAGCYLYNFGNRREITDAEMEFQLNLYLKFWKQKKIDGIIVCANNIADTGVHAVDIFREWNAAHGNEIR